MRYKPERALTPATHLTPLASKRLVEMRYKPERALTLHKYQSTQLYFPVVEMRYKPERALTPMDVVSFTVVAAGRNEV